MVSRLVSRGFLADEVSCGHECVADVLRFREDFVGSVVSNCVYGLACLIGQEASVFPDFGLRAGLVSGSLEVVGFFSLFHHGIEAIVSL